MEEEESEGKEQKEKEEKREREERRGQPPSRLVMCISLQRLWVQSLFGGEAWKNFPKEPWSFDGDGI